MAINTFFNVVSCGLGYFLGAVFDKIVPIIITLIVGMAVVEGIIILTSPSLEAAAQTLGEAGDIVVAVTGIATFLGTLTLAIRKSSTYAAGAMQKIGRGRSADWM